MDWHSIEYLKNGNQSQKLAYLILHNHRLIEILHEYKPILVGTIPIGIDIESSDLDIICHIVDFNEFTELLKANFANFDGFKIKHKQLHKIDSVICRFYIDTKLIEIVGQPIPTELQMAYRHMVIEYKILLKSGDIFKSRIIELKKSGIKTEPAFAQLLNLAGNPYEALLNYKI